MDISGFGPFRSGFPFPGPGQEEKSLIGGAPRPDGQEALGRGRNPDLVDVNSGLLRSREQDQLSAFTQALGSGSVPAESSSGGVLADAIGAAFDEIEDDVASMFEAMGMSEDRAAETASVFLDELQNRALTADEFSFNFEQAVASYSETTAMYMDGGSVAQGRQVNASLEVKALDIYVNNNTGEFSINFAQASVEVTETEVTALGSSAVGAANAMGQVLGMFDQPAIDGAGNPANLLGQDNGLFFDPSASSGGSSDSGFGDFIQRILAATANGGEEPEEGEEGQGTGDAVLDAQLEQQRQIFESALAFIRDFQADVADPAGGSDPFSRLTLDLSVPLGSLAGDNDGAAFEDVNGNRSRLAAPEQAGLSVEV